MRYHVAPYRKDGSEPTAVSGYESMRAYGIDAAYEAAQAFRCALRDRGDVQEGDTVEIRDSDGILVARWRWETTPGLASAWFLRNE